MYATSIYPFRNSTHKITSCRWLDESVTYPALVLQAPDFFRRRPSRNCVNYFVVTMVFHLLNFHQRFTYMMLHIFTSSSLFYSSVDVQSTLFVVFDVYSGIFSRYAGIVQIFNEKILEGLTKMLAVIPDARKVVISCLPPNTFDERSNTLHVVYKDLYDKSRFVATLLEILSKRWQTLDIISVMQEVQRNMFAIQHRNSADDYSKYSGRYYQRDNPVIIKDSLCSIPRLQKTDETSE